MTVTAGVLDPGHSSPITHHSALRYVADAYRYRRRPTRVVMVGSVGVGGDNPIRVQSMTTTDTMDTEGTVAQTIRLVEAGCEIVRITAPTVEDARNLGNIRRELERRDIRVPLVADIHFSPAAAMEAAEHVDKVRVNPGNFADSKRFAVREYTDAEYDAELDRIEARFAPLVEKCKARGIGTGSLLDDGIGDTIRVSLTEDPEWEVPVAFALARPYQSRRGEGETRRHGEERVPASPRPRVPAPTLPDHRDPYQYTRRPAS